MANTDAVYLGEVSLYPYNFIPAGWAPCDGRSLPISQSEALYQLLQTRFGGDGKTTFNLPDLRGKAPTPDMLYCIAVMGVYPSQN